MLPPQLLHPVRLGREDSGVAEGGAMSVVPCAAGSAGSLDFGTADLADMRRR